MSKSGSQISETLRGKPPLIVHYQIIVDETCKKIRKVDENHVLARSLSAIMYKGKPGGRIIAILCTTRKDKSLLGSFFNAQHQGSRLLFFPGILPRNVVFYNQRKEMVAHPVNHVTYESPESCHFTFDGVDKSEKGFDKIPTFPALKLSTPNYVHRWFGLSVRDISVLTPAENIEVAVETPDKDVQRRADEVRKIDMTDGFKIDLEDFYEKNREYLGLKGHPLHLEVLVTDKNQKPRVHPKMSADREGKIRTINGYRWMPEVRKGIYVYLFPASIKGDKNAPAFFSAQKRK